MKVLIVGGYGLIGSEITRALLREGFTLTGIARPGKAGANRGGALAGGVNWIEADLQEMTSTESWLPLVDGCEAVINASGALQSGGRDNLAAIQRDAICALVAASETAGIANFVQISAPGAVRSETLEFLATKGAADDALRQSSLNWTILKPGLVIAATAYGGTSLLRMLAGFPLVQPVVLADARVQSVGVDDVARATLRALREPSLWRREFDLMEPEPRSLENTVLAFRHWLGFAPPIKVLALPRWSGQATARLADLAGRLGWRSPLRSTALAMIEDGVTGDPEPWRQATGERLRALPQILADLPSTLQERVYSRARLLFPLLIVAFSLFWLASGMIGLVSREAAVSVVSDALGDDLASLFVVTGSVLDIAIGIGLLIRKSCRVACLAAAALSAGYLAAGTIVTPVLWADPLGPFVKIIPVIMLALVLATLCEER